MTKYINVGGKDRPFRVSFRALMRFTNKTKTNLANLESSLSNLAHLLLLITIGFEEGAKKEGVSIDFKEKDVTDWLDNDFSLIATCSEAISDSLGGDKVEKTADTKKNPTQAIPI